MMTFPTKAVPVNNHPACRRGRRTARRIARGKRPLVDQHGHARYSLFWITLIASIAVLVFYIVRTIIAEGVA
ncbi:hypothetical protein [Massilia aquatica]|uniref:DUF2970 domain-containing protein n=1 Tax=Massilia aquatica TaxID=2609000 RepID=A0ABX0MII4_9BURK|nr:hypothetical protein [Massilia aquatica]NHZ44695.1 hypothetical protein [Massilia aquatica]